MSSNTHGITPQDPGLLRQSLIDSLTTMTESTHTCEAASPDSARAGGGPHSSEGKSFQKARHEDLEFSKMFFEELSNKRELHFFLEDTQGLQFKSKCSVSLDSSHPFLMSLAKWAGEKNPTEAFSTFTLSDPLSVFQIMLVGELMTPFTSEEDLLIAQLNKMGNASQQIKITSPEIKLLPDRKLEAVWKVYVKTLGWYSVLQEVKISSQGEGLPCNIETTRTATLLTKEHSNNILLRLFQSIQKFIFPLLQRLKKP